MSAPEFPWYLDLLAGAGVLAFLLVCGWLMEPR